MCFQWSCISERCLKQAETIAFNLTSLYKEWSEEYLCVLAVFYCQVEGVLQIRSLPKRLLTWQQIGWCLQDHDGGLQNLFCTRDKTFTGLYWSQLLLSCFVQFSKPSHDIVMWRAIYICEYIVFAVSILIWRVFLNHCSKSLKTQRSTLYVVLQTVRLFSLNKNALWILAVLIAKRLSACKWLYNIWQLRGKSR